MLLNTVSIDSGTPEQNAGVRNEMEQSLGCQLDPLEILIAEEEGEFDNELAVRMLNRMHTKSVGCSFPQCYIPCSGCSK